MKLFSSLFGGETAAQKREKIVDELKRLRLQLETNKASTIHMNEAFLTKEQLQKRIASLEHDLARLSP